MATEPVKSEPDPTVLTTQQLLRELGSLQAIMDTRLNAMDKAVSLFRQDIARGQAEIDKQTCHLKQFLLERFEVHAQKFANIATQFVERDVRTEQTARDSKVAVDAALQAAKEAVGEQNKSSALAIAKSETATTKQIDQMVLIINSTKTGIDDKIDDMKLRIGRIEGEDKGQKTAQTQQQTSNTSLVGIIGLVVGSVVAVASLAVAFFK